MGWVCLSVMLLWVLAAVAQAGPIAVVYADKFDLLVYQNGSGDPKPVTTLSDWDTRRGHIVENMKLVMGPIKPGSATVPLEVEVLEEASLDGYIRRKILLTVENNDRLPAYLLIPEGLKAPTPAMLCLHPTSPHGKNVVVGLADSPNRNYAEELARRGYVTLAPDYPRMGEYDIDVYAMGYASATAKAVYNHMRAIDYLQSLPEVDPRRIGAIGHSLGGHNTLFLGVFDQRVKVMVTSCGFNSFYKYYGGDLTGWSHKGYMPRIAEVYDKDPAKMPFDFTEVLAALAPRTVFINAPLHDENFAVDGVYDCIKAAQPVFELFGVPGALIAFHPEAGHDFPPDTREHAYRIIDRVLMPAARRSP